MNVFYIGVPPATFLADSWPAEPHRLSDEPMFLIDLLFVFPASDYPTLERTGYQLVVRSGRPVVRVGAVQMPIDKTVAYGNLLMVPGFEAGDAEVFGAWAEDRPRSNYRSVDCKFYDQIEATILEGKEVEVTFTRADGVPLTTHIALQDTKTVRGEEYVQLSDGCWIRLDRIIRLDGRKIG